MFDLLKRAQDLGIEVQIHREYIQTRVYSKGGKQGHLSRFKTIEGLSGFIDGFDVARRVALEITEIEGL